jgi:hypothetical protein
MKFGVLWSRWIGRIIEQCGEDVHDSRQGMTMSAIGIDTLKFARKLKEAVVPEAGVPEDQAEAQAEVLGEAFLYNLDEIVTRDYLDSRLAGVHGRIDGIEGRLDRLESRMDGIEARLDRIEIKIGEIEQHLVAIDGKFRLIYWMLGMIIVVNVIPILTRLILPG